MSTDPIFQPLVFPNLVVKNRIFRSSLSGRFDNYDGSGTQTRINWEEKFAMGGVGAIISSHVPISERGVIIRGYAFIDRDDTVPFWRRVGEAVHRHDCKYIVQLNHSGRQRDYPGVVALNQEAWSSTSRPDPIHGFPCRAMTTAEIKQVVDEFRQAARRVREAGLDGIEIHGANGYLVSQFLSSGVNDRKDEYGGSVENRARLLLEIVAAIRTEVGRDFHLQVKLNAVDRNDAVLFWEKEGNTLADSIPICQLLEAAGVNGIHVSTGSFTPHPRMPPGAFPSAEMNDTYCAMIPFGKNVRFIHRLTSSRWTRWLVEYFWNRSKGEVFEGVNLEDARELKRHLKIPVLVTGGFQTASFIRNAISSEGCDAVSLARALIANNDLPLQMQAGKDLPEKPCTRCNKCGFLVLQGPLGCYDPTRYDGDVARMNRTITSVFQRPEVTH